MKYLKTVALVTLLLLIPLVGSMVNLAMAETDVMVITDRNSTLDDLCEVCEDEPMTTPVSTSDEVLDAAEPESGGGVEVEILPFPDVDSAPACDVIMALRPNIDPEWAKTLAEWLTEYTYHQELIVERVETLVWCDVCEDYHTCVEYQHRKEWVQDIDPILAVCLCYAESSFNPQVTGIEPWYCCGLMQVHYPSHYKRYGLQNRSQLYEDPELNIRVGLDILRRYTADRGTLTGGLNRYGTNTGKVLRLYAKYSE